MTWGGRVDLLYGTDYVYTTARGLDGNLLNQPISTACLASTVVGQSSKDYGLAMPQLYAEGRCYGDHAVKVWPLLYAHRV